MSDKKSVILVIEDDPQIRRVLSTSLGAYGYDLHVAQTAREALTIADQFVPDLFILDLGLPDIDGLELIGNLRRKSTQEILVLSARGDERTKVRALDAGADDYLTKPFSLFELLARVRGAFRRAQEHVDVNDGPLNISSDVSLDIVRRQVTRGGQAVHLTPIEFSLLATLAKHQGKVLTHEQLLTEVWGSAQAHNTQYLRIYMGGLRKKLELNSAQPKLLVTVPGVGYVLASFEIG